MKPQTAPIWEEGRRLSSSSVMVMPLRRPAPELEGSADSFPLPQTTSVNDGEGEAKGERPLGGDRPSKEEGLKRSQSGTSSQRSDEPRRMRGRGRR
jgi:hypothetical protein